MELPLAALRAASLLALAVPALSAQQVVESAGAPSNVIGLGNLLASCGDLDGDGKQDVVSGTLTSAAKVLAYSGPTLAPLWIAELPAHGGVATGLSRAGDIDGDGHGDVLAGFSAVGITHVLSGSNGLVLRTLALPAGAAAFGAAVAGGADVDGDGIGDQVVGAPGALGSAGGVFVYSGATGTLLLQLLGAGSQRLGSAVALLDADHDGHADVAAAAPGAGELRMYSGSGGALLYTAMVPGIAATSTALAAIDDLDGDLTPDLFIGSPGSGEALVLAGATGSLLLSLPTSSSTEAFGTAVASAGDLDGDGTRDLLVGSPSFDSNGTQLGRAAAFSGATGAAIWSFSDITNPGVGRGLAELPDVDQDGRPEVAVGAIGAASGSPLPLGAVLAVSTVACGSALSFGAMCGGPAGFAALHLSGCAHSGAPVSLVTQSDFGSGAFAFLFFSQSLGSTPLPGGCSLALGPVQGMVAVPIIGPIGQSSFSGVVPSLAGAATLYAQAAVRNKLDHTLTVSNGLAITFLP